MRAAGRQRARYECRVKHQATVKCVWYAHHARAHAKRKKGITEKDREIERGMERDADMKRTERNKRRAKHLSFEIHFEIHFEIPFWNSVLRLF